MKKITIIILCVLCVACISHRNVTDNNAKKSYKIGNVQFYQIEREQYDSIFGKSFSAYLLKNKYLSSVSYYVSKDKKVSAVICQYKNSLGEVKSIQDGLSGLKWLNIDPARGDKLLSSGSASIDQKFVFAIEFTNIGTNATGKILIDAVLNFEKIHIMSDAAHRDIVVGLLDALTMERMNVKLVLKPDLRTEK